MNGIYWGLTALALMDKTDALPKIEMIKWVMSCWDEEQGPSGSLTFVTISKLMRHAMTGAFSPHPGHDVHLHPTLSAIQILAIQDSLHLLNVDKIVSCKLIYLLSHHSHLI
jgi:geranylgeranyl transferase type-2 subunit beta